MPPGRAMLIGERIKALRARNGKSQAEVARAIGASLNAMNYIESGAHAPHLDRLLALADLFSVSLDYLVGLTDDPTPPRRARRKRPAPDADEEPQGWEKVGGR
jgi:transcriptional regulator with XRE-family HTH domain